MPATQVWSTSAAVPLKSTAAARCSGATPRMSGWLRSSAARSAGAPAASSERARPRLRAPLVRQAAPERRRGARVAGGDQHVAATALAARAALRLARLLERVEAHVRVGAERDRHAAPPELGGGQEAVAEVGLGGRAGTDGGARLRQQVELGGRDVRRVHDGRALAEHAARGEVLERAQAELLERLLDLARLLARVDVERKAGRGGVRGDRDQPLARHRPQRVRRVADGHERIARHRGGEALDAREVGLDASDRRSAAARAWARARPRRARTPPSAARCARRRPARPRARRARARSAPRRARRRAGGGRSGTRRPSCSRRAGRRRSTPPPPRACRAGRAPRRPRTSTRATTRSRPRARPRRAPRRGRGGGAGTRASGR